MLRSRFHPFRGERRGALVWLLIAGWLSLTALLCAAGFGWSYGYSLRSLVAKATRQSQADATALQSALEKNETLPFVMARHGDVIAALTHSDEPAFISRLNEYLVDVASHAHVSVAYVVNADGLTVAASNWATPQTFVGNNYRFRPYMQEALSGRIGRFYGIGTTTREPGYFLAHPVRLPDPQSGREGAVAGAVVIKTVLDDLERSWAAAEGKVLLSDADGVIFLSNDKSLKYRSLAPLSVEALARLAERRQYIGRDIESIDPHAGNAAARIVLPVGPLDWQLIQLLPNATPRRAGVAGAAAAALLSALSGMAVYAAYQRRARIRAALASRAQLIEVSQALEQTIETRTRDLIRANADLGGRYEQLQEAEHILRATQNELVQAGKLGMLGQMAAGVTHELSQPLTALRSFAGNASAFLRLGDLASAQQSLAHIDDSCERMASIIGQLKGFARKSSDTLAPVRLTDCVDAALRLLRHDIELGGVQLDLPCQDTAFVLADSIRLEQVIVNLLRNALDAVQESAVKRVEVRTWAQGDCACLQISDSGDGIPGHALDRLFEPFFTTKPPGKGLGLGLAISSSIVQAMQGELVASNSAAGGAQFLLKLPLVRIAP
jgi:two-component system, NtrC family, C4-dicarboxylate transport sensor histidine kinase DctB